MTRPTAWTRLAALGLVIGLAACAGSNDAESNGLSPDWPRTLSDPAPNDDGLVRVLVYHDMEGLSGQDDPDTFRFAHREKYAIGQTYLTGDVNAVVAGLFEGGADEVHIVDGHGSGNPEPDLLVDQLDPRVVRVTRTEPFDAYVDLSEAGVYDAIAVVGMHAKTGSGGFASHTFTLGIGMAFNDMRVTETEIIGYSWGRVGVPVIFASGDDRLSADLEAAMPWVETVVVKTATSASTADLRPVEEARADLTAGARRAMESYESARVMALVPPIVARLEVVPPATLLMLDGVPGVEYADETVTFQTSEFRRAYDGLLALIGVARGGYSTVGSSVANERYGSEYGMAYADALFDRWLDYESGRWTPVGGPGAPSGATYHGFR